MIKTIIGLIIGILITFCIWTVVPLDLNNTKTQCMTQEVYLLGPSSNRTSPFIIIGETVICGKNWKISNIMGPYVENFYGEIQLRDWNPEEFKELK